MGKLLTAAAVERIRAVDKRLEIPDGGCPGLHLVVQPSGAKSWALRYRRPDGRSAKLVLGSAFVSKGSEPDLEPVIGGYLTLAAARRLVASLRHELAQGRDPGLSYLDQKKKRRDLLVGDVANNFADAARRFIDEHARKKTRRWHEQSRLLGFNPKDLTLVKDGLAERWIRKHLHEIGPQDIYNVVDEARRLGVPGLPRRSSGLTESRARALLSCLSRMFSWHQQHRHIANNPCSGVYRPKAPKSRDRVLSDDEIVKLWKRLDDRLAPFSVTLKILLLTGCRLNEVAGMKKGELDLNKRVWVIPSQRSKNGREHAVPLVPLVCSLIESTLALSVDSDFIFTTTGSTPISGWSKFKRRLDRLIDIPPWRLHDLRRTAATGMIALGVAPAVVEATLNHVSGARAGVAGIYNRYAYSAEKQLALQRWANHIIDLTTSRGAKVIPLAPRVGLA